ncbi:MAG: preprotein translocase subunit SecY [Alphaproteobacteria bacterium]|nr:preprotein translocase subunit SecY [Alphaproteobacteria bacterium]
MAQSKKSLNILSGGLKEKILFTLFALIIYRLGSFIPLPGVDASVLSNMFDGQSGVLGMFDMFTGGALSRMAILALNIMPYISASIIMQLMVAVTPELKALKEQGAVGYQKINQYTRYLTVLIAVVQSYGISVGLEGYVVNGVQAVYSPGLFFRLSTIMSLTAGAMFVVWLGEQITQRGVGQGASLIIFSGIVAHFPVALSKTFELGKVGQLSPIAVIFLLGIALFATWVVSFFELAERRVQVHYPKRSAMPGMSARSDSSYIPLKVNTADVIPAIFASSLLLMPATLLKFISDENSPIILQRIVGFLQHGSVGYMLLYAVLIVFFCFFYTAIVFNPKETADNIKKSGGFIPGIRPGEQTASHLDYILTRITVVGAAYLVGICLLPDILITQMAVPFYLGGTTLLIVCNVILKTASQIQAQVMTQQYQSVLKKIGKHKRFR